MKRMSRLVVFVGIIVLLLTGCGAVQAAKKPIAFVVGGEQFDVPRFTKRVLAPSGYVWEECGKFLDPKEFDRYSIVVWLAGSPQAFSEEQIDALVSYLEAGGHILHTAGGLYTTGLGARNLKPYPWTGAERWNYFSQRRDYAVLLPDHPYFEGVDLERTYIWQTAHYALTIKTNETQNLIGEGTRSIFCSTPVGKGENIWFWEGPFRARDWEKPEDGDVLDHVFLNVLAGANPLKAEDQLRQEVPELAGDPAALVCWRRDWNYAFQDDYVFLPGFPKPSEALNQLDFASAMNERDTQFFLCQSLCAQNVRAEVSPLTCSNRGETVEGHLQLHVSDRPPVVPSLVRKGKEDLPDKLGRFMLMPIQAFFTIENWRPRVLWVELSTQGLAPGMYTASLKLTGETAVREIPIQVKVYPVRMPRKRIAELLYWGGSIPSREPFMAELERQSCPQISLTYPSTAAIRLRATGQSLRDAIRKNPKVFEVDNFPALDFRGAYETNLLLALSRGLSNIRVHDVRTGKWIAQAGSGMKLDDLDLDQWPDEARQLYTAYYRELYTFLQEKGFNDVDLIWSDEPGWDYIQNGYIPRARMHMEGGMGSGTHWTASGFMTSEQVNAFAPYTTDWSMYSIILPNFLKFVREGSVELHPRSRVGMTRGGCGYALRNPFNRSRTLAWEMVHYGSPVNYLRTGPIWKEWLYYVDFNLSRSNRPDGVEGERLLAYGCSDPQNADVPMLSSSDWEASREGVDDVNLVRMLEWYLDHLDHDGWFGFRRRRLVHAIRADVASWFRMEGTNVSATAGFDDRRLTGEADGLEAKVVDDCFSGFWVRRKRYGHGDNRYDYDVLVPPSSEVLEKLKRRVLDHLESLQPYAGKVKGSLQWHDWDLVVDGRSRTDLIVPENATVPVQEAVDQLLAQCCVLSGGAPERVSASDWKQKKDKISLVVGQASDAPVRELLAERGWAADAEYPGRGNYLIKRDRTNNLLLIVGVDEPGLLLGLRNFAVFLDGQGAWLQKK